MVKSIKKNKMKRKSKKEEDIQKLMQEYIRVLQAMNMRQFLSQNKGEKG